MSSINFSSLEPLEQRIAPAGLVTAAFADGVLTLSGADGQDHDVDVIKTGKTKFSVTGTGTDINEVGNASQNFNGKLKEVRIDGGGGADTFSLTDLKPLKVLNFNGGNGVDLLTTTNLKGAKGGKVEIALGSESGSVEFNGDKTNIRGSLSLDLGGGGSVRLLSAETVVGGNVSLTGGGQSDTVTISGASTILKGQLNFLAGDGDDSFSATGASLNVKGAVTMDGQAGTNHFLFGAKKNTFGTSLAPASVDLKLGVGPGSAVFSGNSTVISGNLDVDLGSGGGLAKLSSAVTSVTKNVEIAGGAGNDVVELAGRTSLGQNLTFNGGEGDDTLTASGDLLSVAGVTTINGGSGASVTDLSVTKLSLGGLAVTGGASNDTVRIVADGTIAGDVNLALGADGTGPSSVILQSAAGTTNGLKFGGDLTINMTGVTVDTLTIANIQVAKSFSARTGENVSTINISSLEVKSNFKLESGSGADVVNIDNITTRDFYVDTEEGADELRIERSSLYAGPSQVLGIATILTGIGADQIRIGDASVPGNLQVMFKGEMSLDAGDGANMRNDIVGSNSFKSEPTIIATGGTLTQTEAS
jgi:hypothetical protein